MDVRGPSNGEARAPFLAQVAHPRACAVNYCLSQGPDAGFLFGGGGMYGGGS